MPPQSCPGKAGADDVSIRLYSPNGRFSSEGEVPDAPLNETTHESIALIRPKM
jgi:hypothetical protein